MLAIAFISILCYYFVQLSDEKTVENDERKKRETELADERDDILRHSQSIRHGAGGKPIEQQVKSFLDEEEDKVVEEGQDQTAVTQAGLLIVDNSPVKGINNVIGDYEKGAIQTSAVQAMGDKGHHKITDSGFILQPGAHFDAGHKRHRSQYYEGEVHSSQASIQEEDLPSARLEHTPHIEARKSLHTMGMTGYTTPGRMTPVGGSRQEQIFEQSPQMIVSERSGPNDMEFQAKADYRL